MQKRETVGNVHIIHISSAYCVVRRRLHITKMKLLRIVRQQHEHAKPSVTWLRRTTSRRDWRGDAFLTSECFSASSESSSDLRDAGCPFWSPTPGKPQTQHLQSLHHHKLPASHSYYPQFTGGDREAERDDRTCLKIKRVLSVHTRIRTRVSLVSTLGQLPQPPVSLDHRYFQTVTDLHTRIHVQSPRPLQPLQPSFGLFKDNKLKHQHSVGSKNKMEAHGYVCDWHNASAGFTVN